MRGRWAPTYTVRHLPAAVLQQQLRLRCPLFSLPKPSRCVPRDSATGPCCGCLTDQHPNFQAHCRGWCHSKEGGDLCDTEVGQSPNRSASLVQQRGVSSPNQGTQHDCACTMHSHDKQGGKLTQQLPVGKDPNRAGRAWPCRMHRSSTEDGDKGNTHFAQGLQWLEQATVLLLTRRIASFTRFGTGRKNSVSVSVKHLAGVLAQVTVGLTLMVVCFDLLCATCIWPQGKADGIWLQASLTSWSKELSVLVCLACQLSGVLVGIVHNVASQCTQGKVSVRIVRAEYFHADEAHQLVKRDLCQG